MAGTFDAISPRFTQRGERPGGLADEIRGVSLAVAQNWFVKLPECREKDDAIEQLAKATELACAAASTVR